MTRSSRTATFPPLRSTTFAIYSRAGLRMLYSLFQTIIKPPRTGFGSILGGLFLFHLCPRRGIIIFFLLHKYTCFPGIFPVRFPQQAAKSPPRKMRGGLFQSVNQAFLLCFSALMSFSSSLSFALLMPYWAIYASVSLVKSSTFFVEVKVLA